MDPNSQLNIPPAKVLRPDFPSKPDLFDEVKWGPFPTDEDVEKAYYLWSIQDQSLAPQEVEPSANPPLSGVNVDEYNASYCLVSNVYQTIIEDGKVPISKGEWNPTAQYQVDRVSKKLKAFLYEELFPEERSPEIVGETGLEVTINGTKLKAKSWTKGDLQKELESRGLDKVGNVEQLKKRLSEDELQRRQAASEHKHSLLPLEDLSPWGIHRRHEYLLKLARGTDLTPLDMYTWAISLSPYNPAFWTSRAYLHYQLGFPDLALGDAYRAQLLCEVLANALQRNKQPGLYVRIWDAIERHVLLTARKNDKMKAAADLLRKPNGINAFIPAVRKAVHHIIALSLLAMQCWRDYQAIEPYLTTRVVMPDRDAMAIKRREQGLSKFVAKMIDTMEEDQGLFHYEGHYGYVSGRRYPQMPAENSRLTAEFVGRLNSDVLGGSLAPIESSSKIEVRVDGEKDSGRLGVFAKEPIRKGEIVYADEPSLRGHLKFRNVSGPDTHTCENCKQNLGADPTRHGKNAQHVALCNCSELGEPIYWCGSRSEDDEGQATSNRSGATNNKGGNANKRSQTREPEGNERPKKKARTENDPISCLDIAQSLYHYRVCGKDWSWLYDTARPILSKGDRAVSTGPYFTHNNEEHGAVLGLLLREVFDITLERQDKEDKPNLLPYEIDELMPLEGAGDLPMHNFPCSFAANIRVPFDILSYLGVNIFRDMRFDTWTIQLVLRKLLVNAIPWDVARRGKDNVDGEKARFDRDGPLDVSSADAIEPSFKDLYIFPGAAMFNHTCDKGHNVTWQWDSTIPNRIFFRANRDIEENEELTVKYSDKALNIRQQYRFLGERCICRHCFKSKKKLPSPSRDEAIYGEDTSDEDIPESRLASVSSGFSGPVYPHPPKTSHSEVEPDDSQQTFQLLSDSPQPQGTGGDGTKESGKEGKGPRVWSGGEITRASKLSVIPEEGEEEYDEEEEEEEEECDEEEEIEEDGEESSGADDNGDGDYTE